jgi:gluconolactonase
VSAPEAPRGGNERESSAGVGNTNESTEGVVLMSVNKSVRIAGTLAGTLLVNALMVGDPSPAAAAAMAMAPQGASRTVSMQDLCGDCKPEKFVQCGDFLEGPAFDDKDNLWMVSIESGNIEKVTPDGQCTTAAKTGGEPQGLKFHDGKLYGVDRKRGVFTIDPASGKVDDYMRYFNNENFHGPNDLIVDQAGGIYFTDPWGSSVLHATGGLYYVAPDKKITRLADNLHFPNGVTLSPDDKTLYIGDFNAQEVVAVPIISPGVIDVGFAHVAAHLSGGWGTDGLATDANGNVYVAHYMGQEVVVLDPNGFIVGTIALPEGAGAQTTNVAFNNGYLYITEAGKNEVWRVKMNVEGAKLH